MIDFVSLHTHTHSSLLDGFSTDTDYLNKAEELGQRGLGISDHGNLHTIYSFLKKSKERGMIGVPGCEFYLAPINSDGAKRQSQVFYGAGGKRSERYDVSSNGAYLHLTIWAYNNVGLHNLFRLSTLSNDPTRFYKKPRIDFDLLADNSEGLVVSTGCPSSEISTRFLLGQDDKAYEYAGRLKEVFGDRLFVEIMDHNMPIDLEKILLPKQMELSKKMDIPLLATNDCHYAEQQDHVSHEEMLCVQSGARMTDKTYDEGGPRFAFTGHEYYLKSGEEMSEIFPDRDFPNALSNSVAIAEMASDISLEYDPHLKPKPVIPEGFKDEVEYYKHLIQKGFKERYGNESIEVKKEAIKRNKKEFDVIHSSDFIGYMLVVTDYLKFARENYSTKNEQDDIIALGIGPGRGSVGGSIHAYELGISEVDPVKHDLIFERFLSAGRGATYLIEYDDGTTEEIIVSDTKKTLPSIDKNFESDNEIVNKYIHQLNVGDTIVVDETDNEIGKNKND